MSERADLSPVGLAVFGDSATSGLPGPRHENPASLVFSSTLRAEGISRRNDTTTIANKHTIPPLLVPVYSRRIANLKKVQQLVRFLFPSHLDESNREDPIHAGPGASPPERVLLPSSPYVATNTSRATRASKNASRICEVTWEASRL